MTDIFDEVQEDIRRERMKKIWERWGVYIVAVAVLIVLAVAGWRGWQWYSQREAAAAGARFEAALTLARNDKSAEALKDLDAIAASAPGGYGLLARFRAAAETARKDPKAAVAAFDAIAGQGGVSVQVKDLAKLRAAMILLAQKDRAGVVAHAQALAAPGNPWRDSAREILALAAWQAGDLATTQKLAQEMVVDAQTPAGVRQRASILLDLAASAEAAKNSPHPITVAPAASGPELPAIEAPTVPMAPPPPAAAPPAEPPPAAPPAH
jgi:hypothetical protein